MIDLDHRFDAAVDDLRRSVGAFQPTAVVTISRRARRQRRGRTASLALAALVGVAGLGVVVTRHTGTPEAAESATATPDPARALADRLLFPSTTSGATTMTVTLGPPPVAEASALVGSPDGALFRISIGLSSGELTPGAPRRTFNDRVYDADVIDGLVSYQSLSACARVSVNESSQTPELWDRDALMVLDGLDVTGKTGRLSLPDGWTFYGAGRPGTRIQLPLTMSIDGRQIGVNLTQFIDTSIAFAASGVLSATDVRGQAGWTSAEPGGITNLLWDDNGTAVSLRGVATIDELRQIAVNLEHGHADEWLAHLAGTTEVLPGDTAPPRDASENGNNSSSCGLADLSIDRTVDASTDSPPTTRP